MFILHCLEKSLEQNYSMKQLFSVSTSFENIF